MLMKLLPRQVNSFRTGKAIQCVRFDGMENSLRLTGRRHEIKPSARRESSGVQSQNVLGDGIAAAKTIEQPAVEVFLAESRLKRFDQFFIHYCPRTKNYSG